MGIAEVEQEVQNDSGIVSRQNSDADTLKKRMDSESSSCSELDCLEPLGLDDLKRCRSLDRKKKGVKSLESMSETEDDLNSNNNMVAPSTKFFSVAMTLIEKNKGHHHHKDNKKEEDDAHSRAVKNWKRALKAMKNRKDPWEKFHMNKLPVENATRHRYNALTKTWSVDQVVCKIDNEPFNHGAMRECFRMKKLSNFCVHGQDWNNDCNNFVAKRYMDETVEAATYYEDVRLQMEAKLWGEEYNRHNPPKKVDIFQMAVVEFHERKGKPIFHIEHFIDGEYIKYNSNSGFVENGMCRQTPHAFSHFTFERSGHELIVVDIQGVGDLYTDPQIHTANGDDYGDGNLGTKGMALFFHSHMCNRICKRLGLTAFDLAPKELEKLKSISSGSSRDVSRCETVLRGNEVPCESEKINFQKMFRHRSGSGSSFDQFRFSPRQRTFSDYYSNEESGGGSPPNSASIIEDVEMVDHPPMMPPSCHGHKRRIRYMSESSEDSGIRAMEIDKFQEALKKKSRPSCITSEMSFNNNTDDSLLGQVHLDLARYHEILRFVEEEGSEDYDRESALFHLKAAADCGILNAIVAYARMHFGLAHDILSDIVLEHPDIKIGLLYMNQAACAGDRTSMVFLARAFDAGAYGVVRNLETALHWYEEIIDMDENELDDVGNEEWGMDDTPYLILARAAEIIWKGMEPNLKPDPNKAGEYYNKAAETAMSCMKGKLANKYYMLAEEAWAEVEE